MSWADDGGNTYSLLPGGNQSFPGMYQDTSGNVILFGSDVNTLGSIWIFKDPMNPGPTKTVVV